MNVFATFACPERSARWLDDQRQIKMILESCQMMSAVSAIYGDWKPGLCGVTHMTHPCVLWAAQGRDNWQWLWDHATMLDKLRRDRVTAKGQSPHKTLQSMHKVRAWSVLSKMPYGSTTHANCARHLGLGIDYSHIEDVHKAYRLYLNHRWLMQPRPAVCTLRKTL